MADNTIKNEREQRKLYLRARQRMILSGTIGFLVVAVIVSLLGAFGVFSPAKKAQGSKQTNYGVVTACPPEGAVSLNSSEITLRVLNGTNKSGLGTAVGEELRNRGFILQGVGDYESDSVMERTEIHFGANAITQAYTLAEQFNDAILRMDNRTDNLIDVVIGSSFNDLIDTTKTPKAGTAITALPNCVGADQLKDVPEASEHQAV
ncbi:LytR C-terminal domain-containing protein [Alloscardovia criceti]|uniref:LytR C-terminal domain-containing protein n=1 Tax=Alloscardovia criceti TaxID=356828 RepID=UPI00036AF914|nr:LytR C-terminal domain-containing protein [Alloscardovia criceti]